MSESQGNAPGAQAGAAALSMAVQFTETALNVGRDFIGALLSDETFAKEIQKALTPKPPTHTYLPVDAPMAKVLYAVLKLQHEFLRLDGAASDEDRLHIPKADRKTVCDKLFGERKNTADRKEDRKQDRKEEREVSHILDSLLSGRYILRGNTRHLNEKGAAGVGHEIFEPRVDLVASCSDTAIVLLSLLDTAGQKVRATSPSTSDPFSEIDGKVDRKEFVNMLLSKPMNRPLSYFSATDLLGEPGVKGKLDELADAGEYLERVSATHIRPRMRIALERLYLELLALHPPLDVLRDYSWIPSQSKWQRTRKAGA